MKNSLLNFLACPIDHHFPLVVSERRIFDEISIEEGNLQCLKCRRLFPVVDGIPSFLPDELREPQNAESLDPQVRLKLQEMQSRNQEYRADMYDSFLDSYSTRLELESLIKRLAAKPGELILDAGCGNGRVTLEVAKFSGTEILAVDFAIDSLRVLKEKLKSVANSSVHLIHADISFLPLRADVCHKVVSHGVFEHLPNLTNNPKALEEVKRVMATKGSFVMTVYNYSDLKACITSLLSKFANNGKVYTKEGFHADSIYYYRFTPYELEHLLREFFYIEELTGLRNIHRKIGNKMGRLAMGIDQALENFKFSHQIGFWLLVKCVKQRRRLRKTINLNSPREI